MSVLNREEFFARLNERLANDNSDDGISFLEDMTDTYNDLEHKANGDGVDWEKKCREIYEGWKKGYRHRFFSGGSDFIADSSTDKEDDYSPEDVKIDDLFNKKEDK